jgi:DNA-binding SARP family transcriptional activator
MSVLRIQLLGDFHLVYDGKSVTSVNSARLRSLLVYLLLHQHSPQLRQQIAFLFWPDTSEKQALTNLRQLLHHLRNALPDAEQFLSIDAAALQWRTESPFVLDLNEYEDALKEAKKFYQVQNTNSARDSLVRAVDLYRGSLVPSCYDDWIDDERERLNQSLAKALDQLVTLFEQQRDYPTAITYTLRLLQLEPLQETAYRRLIHLHDLNGERANALLIYQRCASILKRELGVEPNRATQAMYERLLKPDAIVATLSDPEAPISERFSLVGRLAELEKLRQLWHDAIPGHAHLTLISGDAGIGKTRLCKELAAWGSQIGVTVIISQSYAAQGDLAYGPIIEWLRTEAVTRTIFQLEDIWLSEVARLLPEIWTRRPDLSRPGPLAESWQRGHFFEALARAMWQGKRDLLLVIEDLQWCDQDTLEWLRYFLHSDSDLRLLVVGTMRSASVPLHNSLTALLMALRHSGQLIEIELMPLDRQETAMLAYQVAGETLPDNEVAWLYDVTEGNALFVVEMVRASRLTTTYSERTDAATIDQPIGIQPLKMPPKVQAVIESRLETLSPAARDLASLAAVIGRQFKFRVLAFATDIGEDELTHALDELWHRHIVRDQAKGTYDFSHDRIRDVVYAMTSSPRRRLLHKRVAQALESFYANDLDTVSGQLGFHYEQAGVAETAIAYYHRAGRRAQRTFAHEEAISLFSKGLALLEEVPDSNLKLSQELALQLALAATTRVTRGYTALESEQALERAQELCQQLGETEQLFLTLIELYMFFGVAGNTYRAYELSNRLMSLATELDRRAYLVAAHHAIGGSCFMEGHFIRSRQHFAASVTLWEPHQPELQGSILGAEFGMFSRAWLSHAVWLLGYAGQALDTAREALKLAEESFHPFSLAIALSYAATLHQWHGEHEACANLLIKAIHCCETYGVDYYLRWCLILQAWLVAKELPSDETIRRLWQCIEDFKASRSGIRLSYYYSLLIDVCLAAGQIDAGLRYLSEVQGITQDKGEHFWDSELCRLEGHLLLAAAAPATEIENCYLRALRIANQQCAKSLELRAAISLCRLRMLQNRHSEGRDLLSNTYHWFAEGFSSADLTEAKTLLDQLS